jgi:hypothetical protein
MDTGLAFCTGDPVTANRPVAAAVRTPVRGSGVKAAILSCPPSKRKTNIRTSFGRTNPSRQQASL